MSAVILMGGSVLALSQTRANPFSASDLLVLSNFIMSSESFLQSTESFTPVCLPAFNPAAFLHAYVAFLHKVSTATTFSIETSCSWKLANWMSVIQLTHLMLVPLLENWSFFIHSRLAASSQRPASLGSQKPHKGWSCSDALLDSSRVCLLFAPQSTLTETGLARGMLQLHAKELAELISLLTG